MHTFARHSGSENPDLGKCQTSRVGSKIPGTGQEMFYCRLDNENCRFAMPFGFDYICRHLNNHRFLVFEAEDHGKVMGIVLPD
jgi:hypothetical protein